MAAGHKTGGRSAGTPNRSTRDIRDLLNKLAGKSKDLHLARLHQLAQSSDEHVSVKALSVILAYRFGKPKESVEVSMPEPVKVVWVGLDGKPLA